MMAESVLASWDTSRGFEELQFHTTAIFALLHGVRHVVSAQSQLTPSQTEVLLEWGRGRLSYLVRWLRDWDSWQGLHKGCVTISADGICAMTFPHIASNYLITDVIDPLISLCSTPGGVELVSEELISAVERAWSSVQVAYPNPIDIVQGEEFVWCSGLDSIDAKLTELRTTYTGARASK
ncbi:hypothetical protein L226DRAFT_81346 [Lentinus tigrinus ALCF2SS1-7]|uniref:Uncharacterized protein n=1 Tax=Lentinus tigrinus ALCF2SS1-6 TaxID=1328759 RepID=A0A5C2RW22_9APHY|nr:hypothetical protein L227DRAFT_333939 [Lentinus tigrinus ALCF2SS1-6]RPD74072.1 hypothetical protein L226DRAFT_81346 [Lentinus tigrinus ALCF2SS1-7]